MLRGARALRPMPYIDRKAPSTETGRVLAYMAKKQEPNLTRTLMILTLILTVALALMPKSGTWL